MAGVDDYQFAARDASSGNWVVLDIRESCEHSVRYLAKVWHKLAQAVHNCSELREVRAPNWTTWKPHDWSKANEPHRVKFVAWDGDFLAGFLNLRMNCTSAIDGQPIVYVEHVATFPGNLTTDLWTKRLRDVGPALLAFAVLQGVGIGAKRIGLHADNDAVGWYDRLDRKFGRIFEMRQTGVPGLYPGAISQMYFESSESGALQALEKYRDG